MTRLPPPALRGRFRPAEEARPTARPARLLAAALVAGVATAGIAACRSGPSAPASLVRAAPPPPVSRPETDSYGRLILPEGSTVVIEGDDFAYGSTGEEVAPGAGLNGAKIGRVPHPWPQVLSQLLGGRVRVVQAVYPGDKARDGLARWSTTAPGDLTVIMYGANDYLDEEDRVPPADYARTLQLLADRARSRGGWAMLVTPPPYRGPVVNAGLEPYRQAILAMRGQDRLLTVDLPRILLFSGGFWKDKRRLGPAGQRAIAAAVAGRLLIAPRAAPG